ncbi:YwmB family TATA-box binding protein [Paenibacillus polymyxa]|uniref:YwmB family TATA-box binding protein n=1 Tax=Paenibacillus polymyxa TaxID=1406 RepID=UPI0025B63DA5|nr:YwmB family TATA-box binding protein [Paenibacillus polymyxa]MDN4083537.1 YwmB family TATA-box binding protein [Paenibacillus polymyxa]MDN4110620.1 YwmB family TATA-box binding protein [Paenibacillus polymyxa]
MLKAEMIKKGVIAILVLGTVLVLAGWRYGTLQTNGTDSREAETALRSLLTISDQTPGTLDKLVVKWQGDWIPNHEDPADIAAQIADQLNIPTASKLVENGHTLYRSVRDREDLKIRLNVMERQTGQWYVVVQLESSDTGREQLIQLHKLCAEQLNSIGVQAQWNTSVQRSLQAKESVDQLMKQTEASLAGTISMQAKERYTDATTVAVSYEAPDLPLMVQSGEHQVQMQMAVHENKEQQDKRITLGFPLITIEY